MHAHPLVRRARRAVSLVLALLIMLAAAPMAGAQDSGTVSVTATVGAAQVSVAVCDATATFGANLTSSGTTPVNTGGDTVVPSSVLPGPQRVYYIWTPSCPTGTPFLQVVANGISWAGSVCATSNSGTSSLVIGGQESDLSFGPFSAPNYDNIDQNGTLFRNCSQPLGNNWVTNSASGTYNFNYFYYLHVVSGDTPGTFQTDTIWSVNTV